jgi:defect in organelle trafficking protein DotA
MRQAWARVFWTLLSCLFPVFAMAEETTSVTFTPPASDQSVVYLEDIFGVVDGVLHGTGSQILGTMFGVFNAAVLALGGIVIMYIILVSTMNTAHEGQMLGQKWSSIWVPVRATIGLALLIPKASGYCLMQIFVMWVVVQGAGVADKIWSVALDYLNQGGVIIQANMDPSTSAHAGGNDIANGASTILYGQVCMVAIQTQLETARSHYLDHKKTDYGPCTDGVLSPMKDFCEQSVPDFLSTVDPVSVYSADPTKTDAYTVTMPNFDGDSIYHSFNGVCGTISWAPMDSQSLNKVDNNISSISDSDMETLAKSRAAAVEQMYLTLSTTSRTIVSNDPQINIQQGHDTSDDATDAADDQFGVPEKDSKSVCTSASDYCPGWGQDSGSTAPVLLDGTELQDAIADYNAVMMPALKLISDANDKDNANEERKFIQKAEDRGWILAGSYFFDLALINGNATTNANTTDEASGLGESKFNLDDLDAAYGSNDECSDKFTDLCLFFNKKTTDIEQIKVLFQGDPGNAVPKPSFKSDAKFSAYSGTKASTMFGYASNGMLIDLAEQEGIEPVKIEFKVTFELDNLFKMPSALKISCTRFPWSVACDVQKTVNNIYKDLVWKTADDFIGKAIDSVPGLVDSWIVDPISGMLDSFQIGTQTLMDPGVNPIVALAKLGSSYINFGMTTWVTATGLAVAGSFYPTTYAIIMTIMPLFLTWMGILFTMGFLMAYFIPFLPYMIFTFGAIGWLIAVIESMVAAPIVALGIAHPEGHDALGKSEQGLMILLNVFLRPAMMIVGYIAAISLSFVGVWIMNAGFENVLSYLQSDDIWNNQNLFEPIPWAAIFGYFFANILYTMMYLTIVQKSFTLIAVLPDKVLRWIGGQPEQTGQETTQWSEEGKVKIGEHGKATADAGGAMQSQFSGHVDKAATAKKKGGAKGTATAKPGK